MESTTSADDTRHLEQKLPEGIEVKAVKVARHLSEETLAFTCSIYLDGEKVGEAQNRGHGGPNLYHMDRADEDRLCKIADRWLREEHGEEDVNGAADLLIGDLIQDYEDRKHARKWAREGYAATIKCFNGWTSWQEGAMPGSIYGGMWQETWLVAIPGDESTVDEKIAEYLEDEDVAAYRVVLRGSA